MNFKYSSSNIVGLWWHTIKADVLEVQNEKDVKSDITKNIKIEVKPSETDSSKKATDTDDAKKATDTDSEKAVDGENSAQTTEDIATNQQKTSDDIKDTVEISQVAQQTINTETKNQNKKS